MVLLAPALMALFILALIWTASRRGIEAALALGTFLITVLPEECSVSIPGFLELTTQRVVILTLLVLALREGGRAKRPGNVPLKKTLLLFIGWWVLAACNSIVVKDSLKAVFAEVLDYLAAYYLVARYVRTREGVMGILLGLASGMIVCSGLGLLEIYRGWTFGSLFPAQAHTFGTSGTLYVEEARGLRAQSTFGHPILFGGALAMGIPITLYLLTEIRNAGRRWFLAVGLALQFLCIYKTGSRGAWMALALSLALLVVFCGGRMRKRLLVLGVLTLSVLVTRPGIWETLQNDYTATMDSSSYQGGSYQYRYVLYDLVIQELNRDGLRALWGYGQDSFLALHLSGVLNGEEHAFPSCDSSFAALLIETGYVGFLITCALLWMAVWKTWRNYRRLPRPANRLSMVFLANILAFLSMMTNVAIFRWGQQSVLFWIIVALSMIYPKVLPRKSVARKVGGEALLEQPLPALV